MSTKSLSKKEFRTLHWSEYPSLIKDTFVEFFAEQGLFHGAALAYYALFAMVPFFYLSIVYFGKLIGQEVILTIIEDSLRDRIGIQDVSGIMEFMKQFNFEKGNFFLEIISVITLMITSSAFVLGLRQSINEFYDITVNFSSRKKKMVKNIMTRLVSVAFVGASTLVIVVLYFAQAVILTLSSSIFEQLETIGWVLGVVIQHGFSILSNVIIFTMVFKYVHDGYVHWKLALRGALVTGVLLYVGQLLIKFYLFNYFFGAQGGFAGTFFIILAWVYYSSQIIFFGAKYTCVYAKKSGHPIEFKE